MAEAIAGVRANLRDMLLDLDLLREQTFTRRGKIGRDYSIDRLFGWSSYGC